MREPLIPGAELCCPHCRRWHALIAGPTDEGTPYTRNMLFFECRKGPYYAGQIGGTARFQTRRPAGGPHRQVPVARRPEAG